MRLYLKIAIILSLFLLISCYNEDVAINNVNRIFMTKDYMNVIDKCDEIILKNPRNHKALHLRGVAHYYTNNLEKSLEDLNLACKYYNNEIYYYNLSLTQFKLLKYNDCLISTSYISDSTKLINRDDLYLHKAYVFFNLSRYDDAIKYFEYSFSNVGLNNSILINKIINYYQNNKFDTAYYLLNNHLNYDSLSFAYLFHASTAYHLNKYDKSINSFKKYLSFNDILPKSFLKEYSYSYKNFADSLVLSNQRLKALEYYSKAIEVYPNNKDAYFQRGILYYENKLFEEALIDMKKSALLGNFQANQYIDILN